MNASIRVKLEATVFYCRVQCAICGSWFKRGDVTAYVVPDEDERSEDVCKDCLTAGAAAARKRLLEFAERIAGWRRHVLDLAKHDFVFPLPEEIDAAEAVNKAEWEAQYPELRDGDGIA